MCPGTPCLPGLQKESLLCSYPREKTDLTELEEPSAEELLAESGPCLKPALSVAANGRPWD